MQLILDFPINPRYTFDNFVVCTGNRSAWQFARRLLAGEPGENLLYLYGATGSGKTHLLTALALAIGGADGVVPCLPCGELVHGGDASVQFAAIADRLAGVPALLVDDVHLLPAVDRVRTPFWQLFNEFHASGRPVVITGLQPPKQLGNLDEHLISRLLWGLVAQVDVADDDSRRLILKKLAADRHVVLPADVVDLLLAHTPRDLPSLLAALERLHHLALASGRKLTLRLAREAIGLGGN